MCHGGPGMYDNLAPVADMVDGLLPRGEFIQLSSCGHNPWVEQPHQTRKVLRDFLAKLT